MVRSSAIIWHGLRNPAIIERVKEIGYVQVGIVVVELVGRLQRQVGQHGVGKRRHRGFGTGSAKSLLPQAAGRFLVTTSTPLKCIF